MDFAGARVIVVDQIRIIEDLNSLHFESYDFNRNISNQQVDGVIVVDNIENDNVDQVGATLQDEIQFDGLNQDLDLHFIHINA